MNISGIRTYAGFYDYNTGKTVTPDTGQTGEIEPIPEQAFAKEEIPQEEEIALAAEKLDSGGIDFAGQYQPDAVYELKGEDSDIANLDVEKALSDMKKDQILQQYQYFVGESKAGENLISKRENEDFSL